MTQSQYVNPQGEIITSAFKPEDHFIQIKSGQTSNDYLPVQWRLVWYRLLCPQGRITTQIVLFDPSQEVEADVFEWNNERRRSEKIHKISKGIACVRAHVEDGFGGVAEATKTENAVGFGDYLEKAETGAIGRALAMLGYGTQFTGLELNEGDSRIVDAPVNPNRPAGQGNNNKPEESTADVAATVAIKKRVLEMKLRYPEVIGSVFQEKIKSGVKIGTILNRTLDEEERTAVTAFLNKAS